MLDKLEKSKSYRVAEDHRNLYDALVKSYQLDKDLFDSYGKAYSLKRSREDKDKDEDPPAGPDQGLKKRKTSKDSAQAEEPVFETAILKRHKIKEKTWVTLRINPMSKKSLSMIGSRNQKGLQLLILIGMLENKLISDFLRLGSTKLLK
ncbi:hypothetical protein Tco_0260125 [Tanacetum coccineum]